MNHIIIVAIALILLPSSTVIAASLFDLDGDGKVETELISRCGKVIAIKQTIIHQVKNGLKDRITVNWPSAGISEYSAPSMVEATALTYETYKSCVPGEDKGVEFTTTEGKRKFDQGARAVRPGFIVEAFINAVEEMKLGKLKELVLGSKTIFDGKYPVFWSSRTRVSDQRFNYTYRVNNQSTSGVLVTSPEINVELFVPQGETKEVSLYHTDKPPQEELAQLRLRAKDYEFEILVPVLLPSK